MTYKGFTEARKRANTKYFEKMARIPLIVTPEQKKIIEERAKEQNKSVNQYIKGCLNLE